MINKLPSRRDFIMQGAVLAGWSSPIRKKITRNIMLSTKQKQLEIYIPQLLSECEVPGLQISLIQDAGISWSQGFGVKDKETRKPVTQDTVFELASLSKPTFTYAVMKLVDKGQINLDKPLTNYLTETFVSDEPRIKLITPRMILCHTSGLPHGRQGNRPIKLLFEPGKRYQYSATGFDYLQKSINEITRQPLEHLLKESVFDSFRMSNSNFGWQEKYELQRALAYNSNGEHGQTFNEKYRTASAHWREAVAKSNPELSYPSAAAGMYGTAEDFAQLLIEIVEPTIMDSVHLSERLLNEMLKPQIQITKDLSWGLGWGILNTKTDFAYWHWGNWNGLYQHFAAVLKNEKKGIVILTNSGNGLNLCKKLVPIAIGLDIRPLHRFFD